MFRHIGKARTLSHNLKIASLLSFVAGIVNVAGFLSVHRLTTNVTGHFAYLMEEVLNFRFVPAFVFFLYLVFFLAGSFASSFIVEMISRKNERKIFVIPIVLESSILLLVAVSGKYLIQYNLDLVAFGLLFAMGLQNSLVTQIQEPLSAPPILQVFSPILASNYRNYFFIKRTNNGTVFMPLSIFDRELSCSSSRGV